MKETITPEMIAKCQEIMKLGTYDCNKFEIEVAPLAPCSVVQSLFPAILDMALEHLKRKASYSLVEWNTEEPKTCNVEIVFEKNHTMTKRIKNHTLPFYQLHA